MGREYFGDIYGKFCFAIQNSADIQNLITIEYEKDYLWHGCNCYLDEKYIDNFEESSYENKFDVYSYRGEVKW